MPWLRDKLSPTVDKPVEAVDNPATIVDKPVEKKPTSAVLGIYAKQPLPGQVKTRLCPPLTPAEAAELYHCALLETVQRMQLGSFELVICYAGERQWFADNFADVTLMPQRGADLGARMADSLKAFLQQGYQQAVLIGSDSPDLPLALVEQAFVALQRTEVVFAPASDGGYVLIGEATHHPQLFAAMPWSTGEVVSDTLQRINLHQIKAEQLPGWEDLDDLHALQRLLHRSPESTTARYLQQQLAEYF